MNPNVVAQYYLWKKMKEQSCYSLSSARRPDLSDYSGRFTFTGGLLMTFTEERKALYAKLTGQRRSQLFPAGVDEFKWKEVDARIRFARDSTGRITSAVFRQGTAEVRLSKLKSEAIITISPDIYERYEGKYDCGHGRIITIRKAQDKLFARATDQPEVELLPVSQNEFIVRDVNGRVAFIDSGGGRVDRLQFEMLGERTEGVRVDLVK